LCHKKYIHQRKQRLHRHFQYHWNGQQYNGAINAPTGEHLLLAIHGLPEYTQGALKA